MRYLIVPTLLLLLLISSCSDGGSSRDNVPVAASVMDAELKANMVRFVPLLPTGENGLLFVMNPGIPLAQGVTVAPDLTPGAPPFSFTFAGPYDGNGDGVDETTMSGRATFASDPDLSWDGIEGQATINVSNPVGGHVYHTDLTFSTTATAQSVSGSGTFTDPLTGNTTTMSVAAGTPLVMQPATGQAGAVSNACGYSVDGQLNLDVAGATGTMTSLWNFSPDNPQVAVTGASFTDISGHTTTLPDATVDLRCGGSGTINDWEATFDQNYACLPRESGQARLTITVTGPDTITIVDEDPPGSGDVKTYTATILAANPRAVRGFFIGGPDGNHYREDFNWTLAKDGSSFSQISFYVYTEGAKTGALGVCMATATRQP